MNSDEHDNSGARQGIENLKRKVRRWQRRLVVYGNERYLRKIAQAKRSIAELERGLAG